MKSPHGRNRYNLAILREFLAFQPLDLRITLDDESRPRRSHYLGRLRQHPLLWWWDEDLPQGQSLGWSLRRHVIGKGSRLKVAMSFKSVFDGTLEELPEVTTYRCRSAHVEYTARAAK